MALGGSRLRSTVRKPQEISRTEVQGLSGIRREKVSKYRYASGSFSRVLQRHSQEFRRECGCRSGGEVLWGLYSDRFKDNIVSGCGREEGDGGSHLEGCWRRPARGMDLPCCPGVGGRGGGSETAGAGSFPEGSSTDRSVTPHSWGEMEEVGSQPARPGGDPAVEKGGRAGTAVSGRCSGTWETLEEMSWPWIVPCSWERRSRGSGLAGGQSWRHGCRSEGAGGRVIVIGEGLHFL